LNVSVFTVHSPRWAVNSAKGMIPRLRVDATGKINYFGLDRRTADGVARSSELRFFMPAQLPAQHLAQQSAGNSWG